MSLRRKNTGSTAPDLFRGAIVNLARTLIVTGFLLIGFAGNGQSPAGGSLVIVGGGLDEHNDEVFQEMIRLAGGKERAEFAVIPSAGGAPVQSFVYFRSELASYGVSPEKVHLVPVAVMDDDSTKEVDESKWRYNGRDEKLAALIRGCSAVWFTGGDQLRTVRVLYDSLGNDTPVLRAVWEVYRRGGMIGGTSAGAAIMSDTMICGGTGIAALTRGVIRRYDGDDFPEDSGVLVLRGLGFFPHGVVDQHFNQRARIGRLAVVLMNIRPAPGAGSKRLPGFGIDENTALVYYAGVQTMRVLGAGGVSLLNPEKARSVRTPGLRGIENLNLCYLESGDSLDLKTGTLFPAQGKKEIRGDEAYSELFTDHSGVLSRDPATFRELYGRYLMDNKTNRSVETVTMTGASEGIRLTVWKTSGSAGYRSGTLRDGFRYCLSGLIIDLIPVTITVREK